MRLLGHPVHVMLVHFPVALWPAHAALHAFAGRLPDGVAATAGFWALVAGTGLGWLAALAGVSDLVSLAREGDNRRLRIALTHAGINGAVLTAFTGAVALEAAHYPDIRHGTGFVAAEVVVIGLMFAGNFFGGSLVWGGDKQVPSAGNLGT